MGKGEDDVGGRVGGALGGDEEAVDGGAGWDSLDAGFHVEVLGRGFGTC